MSYIEETYSIEQFLAHISKPQASIARSALSSLNRFSMETYQIPGERLFEDIGKERNENKALIVFKQLVDWLQKEHPNVMITFGKAKTQRPFEPLHPRTIKNYVKQLKYILEDCFGIIINDRQFKRKVTMPKPDKFNPDPLTKEELRLITQYSMPSRRVLYMVQKDSGMRIGEGISFRKKDIDFIKDPVEIHLSASMTKTKVARTTFVTKETVPMLKDYVSDKQDNDKIFATNPIHSKAKANEEQYFTTLRKKIGVKHPRFLERYESNKRHVISLHAIRAYTATQCSVAVNEDFGQGIIGHEKYLGQYIRNQDKMPELYKRAENHLMIYETVAVVDQYSELSELRNEVYRIKRDSESFKELTKEKIHLEMEIENQRKELLLARQRS
ncbi:MAG TPA: tyrosine-type recombinase/integrase [Nitrosarchaeum sp.]